MNRRFNIKNEETPMGKFYTTRKKSGRENLGKVIEIFANMPSEVEQKLPSVSHRSLANICAYAGWVDTQSAQTMSN